MAENREYGSYQQSEWPGSTWPQADQPNYPPPGSYNSYSSSNWPSGGIPAQVLRRAEARVAAQKRFFRSLFIYLGVTAAFWLIGIAILVSEHGSTSSKMGIFLPLFITVIGGIRVAWNYFNAFIWEQKSHEERIMEEARRLAH